MLHLGRIGKRVQTIKLRMHLSSLLTEKVSILESSTSTGTLSEYPSSNDGGPMGVL